MAEDQSRREKVDLLIKDMEVQGEQLIQEKKREIEALSSSITTMYKVSSRVFCEPRNIMTLFLRFQARLNEDPQSSQERPLEHLNRVT